MKHCYKNTKQQINATKRDKSTVFEYLCKSCKEVLPLISPALTYSLLPVPLAAETLTDKEPTLLNLNLT